MRIRSALQVLYIEFFLFFLQQGCARVSSWKTRAAGMHVQPVRVTHPPPGCISSRSRCLGFDFSSQALSPVLPASSLWKPSTRQGFHGASPKSVSASLAAGWHMHCRQTALTFPILILLVWDLLGRPKHLFMDTKDNDSWLKFLARKVFYDETSLFSFFKNKIFSQNFALLSAFSEVCWILRE